MEELSINEMVNLPIGRQMYIYTIRVPFKAMSQGNFPFRSPANHVLVRCISSEVTHDGSIVMESDGRDLLNVQIQDVANSIDIMGGNALDVFILKRIGENLNFAGFVMPGNSDLNVYVSHIPHSWNDANKDIVVTITFYGTVIKA